jgi:acyl-CoA thioester hydrolase
MTVEQRVRFEECDPVGIVWHGRYASYFEDARVALGDRYGIGYMDFVERGVLTPLKQVHFDYVLPLRFKDRFTTEAILHWSDGPRLDYEFIIRNAEGEIATRGYTVHLLLACESFELMLAHPPFYREFCARWKAGELHGR